MGANKKEFTTMREQQASEIDKVKRKMSLFDITNEYVQLEGMLYENGGELTPEIEQKLAINKDSLIEKPTNYVGLINKIENDVNYIDNEIKRLQVIKKVKKNSIDRLKNALSTAMQFLNLDKIELRLNTISFRKSISVKFTLPVDELPKKIQKLKIETINKNEIKKMLQSGEQIKGVELVENKNLQIK